MLRTRLIAALGLAACTIAAIPVSANTFRSNPLPRIEGRLCPGIMGMKSDAALQMIDRIRYNAERFDVTLANPEICKPNLLIIFVEDPEKSLNDLMKSQPEMFETLQPAERNALKEQTGPARSWNFVATRTRDGMFVGDRENLSETPQALVWSAHSRIYSPIRREVISSVVLFDGDEMAGHTLTQLADYAVMRSFAVDMDEFPNDQETILSLFSEDEKASEMTATDVAFLKSLYSGMPNLPKLSKDQFIKHQLEEGGGE